MPRATYNSYMNKETMTCGELTVRYNELEKALAKTPKTLYYAKRVDEIKRRMRDTVARIKNAMR